MQAIITLPVRDHINGALRSSLDACGLPWLPVYGMSDLPRARSVLLSQALAHGADRILCIDADIVATPGQILALVNHPRVSGDGAVTGLYALRSGKAWACHAPDSKDESDGCRRAEFAGLGFACISRASLLRLRDNLTTLEDPEVGQWWPFCVPFLERRHGRREYCADDVSLWRRLTSSGTQLWADTSLVVGHQTLTTLMSPTPSGGGVDADRQIFEHAQRVVAEADGDRGRIPEDALLCKEVHAARVLVDLVRNVGLPVGTDPGDELRIAHAYGFGLAGNDGLIDAPLRPAASQHQHEGHTHLHPLSVATDNTHASGPVRHNSDSGER